MPPRQETPAMSTAFQIYFSIDPKRSLEKLHTLIYQRCPKLCPKYRTLKSWSKKYQWQERLQLQEKAVSEGVANKAITANIGQRAKLIAQTQTMIDKGLTKTASLQFYRKRHGITKSSWKSS